MPMPRFLRRCFDLEGRSLCPLGMRCLGDDEGVFLGERHRASGVSVPHRGRNQEMNLRKRRSFSCVRVSAVGDSEGRLDPHPKICSMLRMGRVGHRKLVILDRMRDVDVMCVSGFAAGEKMFLDQCRGFARVSMSGFAADKGVLLRKGRGFDSVRMRTVCDGEGMPLRKQGNVNGVRMRPIRDIKIVLREFQCIRGMGVSAVGNDKGVLLRKGRGFDSVRMGTVCDGEDRRAGIRNQPP